MNTKMQQRVVIVANSLFSGGAEKQLLWIARALLEGGVPCAIFELKSRGANARLEMLIDLARRAGAEVLRAAPGEGYLRRYFRLRHFVRSHPSAVIWTWGFRSDLAISLQRPLRSRQPWMCSIRNGHRRSLTRMKWLIKICTSQGAVYVSNTLAARNMLAEIWPKTLERSKVIYNSVPENNARPVELPRSLPSPLKIVMLGNIDMFTKGYDLVLDMATLLKKAGQNVEIHVAGRPDAGDRFASCIRQRHLQEMVRYHGEAGDPHNFLRMGHCYLLASRSEGMPNALLEAASLGLPIVATRVGDLSRIAVSGVQMRLAPVGDPQALKDAIVTVAEDWPEAVQMGMRGREWCSSLFDTEAIKATLFDTVRDVATYVR